MSSSYHTVLWVPLYFSFILTHAHVNLSLFVFKTYILNLSDVLQTPFISLKLLFEGVVSILSILSIISLYEPIIPIFILSFEAGVQLINFKHIRFQKHLVFIHYSMQYLVFIIQYSLSCVQYLVSSIKYLESSIWLLVSSTQHPVFSIQ